MMNKKSSRYGKVIIPSYKIELNLLGIKLVSKRYGYLINFATGFNIFVKKKGLIELLNGSP